MVHHVGLFLMASRGDVFQLPNTLPSPLPLQVLVAVGIGQNRHSRQWTDHDCSIIEEYTVSYTGMKQYWHQIQLFIDLTNNNFVSLFCSRVDLCDYGLNLQLDRSVKSLRILGRGDLYVLYGCVVLSLPLYPLLWIWPLALGCFLPCDISLRHSLWHSVFILYVEDIPPFLSERCSQPRASSCVHECVKK